MYYTLQLASLRSNASETIMRKSEVTVENIKIV